MWGGLAVSGGPALLQQLRQWLPRFLLAVTGRRAASVSASCGRGCCCGCGSGATRRAAVGDTCRRGAAARGWRPRRYWRDMALC